MVYWKVGRDKIISKCRLSEILLDNKYWDYVIKSRDHNVIKNLLSINEKMIRKNQIFKYYTSSLKEMIKMIKEQLMIKKSS